MNFGETLIGMVKLLYNNSQALVVTNDMKGEFFKQKEELNRTAR